MNMMPRAAKQFGPVLATLALLVGIAGFARLNIATEGVAEFRQRSKAAIDALPMKLGTWEARPLPLDAEARDMLQPNAERRLYYTWEENFKRFGAEYSVIQAKDSRYMTGHAPMNCYPNNGYSTSKQIDRVWKVGEFDIRGTEYVFRRTEPNMAVTMLNVRNFFIFPDGHFGATLRELDEAASNYRKLKYGVVQVQVVTAGEGISDKKRDEIFQNLVGSERSIEMIRILRSGIPK
jgi:hypothetical protein